MEKLLASIKFESIDTGKRDEHGNKMPTMNLHLFGEPVEIHCLLAEAGHKNPEFAKLMQTALNFLREHDFENCPHCNPGRKN